MSNLYLGYDPGGGGAHGVAAIGEAGYVATATLATAEDAVHWLSAQAKGRRPRALGVDTLTLWSTGPAGWRPADRALRAAYPKIARSIAPPNSLRGAMAVNGAAIALALRAVFSDLKITETHPKVLYFHLADAIYDFAGEREEMMRRIRVWLDVECDVDSEHAWDALISAHAARKWESGSWKTDLHQLVAETDRERLIPAHGSSAHYAWPSALAAAVTPPKRRIKASHTRERKWKAAVRVLEDAGHDDVGRLINKYRNALGERSGWDAWLKSHSPLLWKLVEEADDS